ncbi:hypothetical protein LZ31DRAFT_96721 [Colletotrichum somersetense]|nr:hypothetical protein LZ31DRAFT_96721 [Colletotrichum somersetense]
MSVSSQPVSQSGWLAGRVRLAGLYLYSARWISEKEASRRGWKQSEILVQSRRWITARRLGWFRIQGYLWSEYYCQAGPGYETGLDSGELVAWYAWHGMAWLAGWDPY